MQHFGSRKILSINTITILKIQTKHYWQNAFLFGKKTLTSSFSDSSEWSTVGNIEYVLAFWPFRKWEDSDLWAKIYLRVFNYNIATTVLFSRHLKNRISNTVKSDVYTKYFSKYSHYQEAVSGQCLVFFLPSQSILL